MKSFWNFLKKNKLYGFVNLVGLTVSMAFVLLLAVYVQRQLSTDSFQKNADRIYLIASGINLPAAYFFHAEAVSVSKMLIVHLPLCFTILCGIISAFGVGRVGRFIGVMVFAMVDFMLPAIFAADAALFVWGYVLYVINAFLICRLCFRSVNIRGSIKHFFTAPTDKDPFDINDMSGDEDFWFDSDDD